jgi:hypothetical protein
LRGRAVKEHAPLPHRDDPVAIGARGVQRVQVYQNGDAVDALLSVKRRSEPD